MPELPDVAVYVEAIRARTAGRTLREVRLGSPFLLRTVEPPLAAAAGRRVADVRRLGKRIVLALEGELFLALHLMIAGRLHWKEPAPERLPRAALAAFLFEHGALLLTEAGSKRRASLHAARGEAALAALDPGGLEVPEAELEPFRAALARESHTLRRALTDPRLFSGIGGAYADEILHRARLSPLALTGRLEPGETERLYHAARAVLREWTDRLREQAGGRFPEKVTAFREGMAVHGRFGRPCPECGAPVQRIVYSGHEANYCAPCQTGGRLLADRALSRLLGRDWPRRLEEE